MMNELTILTQAIDAAEALAELASTVDVPGADPVRVGTFQSFVKSFAQDAVRACWAYSRIANIEAGKIDPRLTDRDFFKG